MKNYLSKKIILLIFGLALILFAIFSTKISFHDTHEYITVSKFFAGIQNIDLFTSHSLLYPLITSVFLKIWPSFAMLKLANVFWIFLMGVLLLYYFKNKSAFILFAFSPLTWFISIQSTPVLPASFFFLVSFYFFIRKKIKHNLPLSGIFLGLSISFYTPMIIIALIFCLIYFWNESFSDFFKYSIFLIIGLIPRFLTDYYLFKMPFYSFIRYAGSNLVVTLGLHPITRNIQTFVTPGVLLIFIVISPFLFKIYKINFKRFNKLILFLSLTSIVWFIRGAKIKYFLILSPIILLLLSTVLTKKEIKWHCILSIILTIFLTFNFFTIGENILIEKELNIIKEEFNPDFIIGSPFESVKLAAHSWNSKHYFGWHNDLQSSIKNESLIRGYNFEFESKIPLRDKLTFSAEFKRFSNREYNNFILVTEKSEKEFPELTSYNLKKCYEILCVYTF